MKNMLPKSIRVVFLIVLLFSASFVGASNSVVVSHYHPGECSGGWENVDLATGVIAEKLDIKASAILGANTSSVISCSNFPFEARGGKIKKAELFISIAGIEFFEKEIITEDFETDKNTVVNVSEDTLADAVVDFMNESLNEAEPNLATGVSDTQEIEKNKQITYKESVKNIPLEFAYTVNGKDWISLGSIESFKDETFATINLPEFEGIQIDSTTDFQVSLRSIPIFDDRPAVYVDGFDLRIETEKLQQKDTVINEIAIVELDKGDVEVLEEVRLSNDALNIDVESISKNDDLEVRINISSLIDSIENNEIEEVASSTSESVSTLMRPFIILAELFKPSIAYASTTDEVLLDDIDSIDDILNYDDGEYSDSDGLVEESEKEELTEQEADSIDELLDATTTLEVEMSDDEIGDGAVIEDTKKVNESSSTTDEVVNGSETENASSTIRTQIATTTQIEMSTSTDSSIENASTTITVGVENDNATTTIQNDINKSDPDEMLDTLIDTESEMAVSDNSATATESIIATTTEIATTIEEELDTATTSEIDISTTPIIHETRLFDPSEEVIEIETSARIENDEIIIEAPSFNEQFKPGKYIMEMDIVFDDKVFVLSEEFYYGVLAVNLDSSQYELGETAYVQLAALDETGGTLCYAPLVLNITKPNGDQDSFSVGDNSIQLNSTCGPNNVTDEPDYFLDYSVEEVGVYEIELLNQETGFVIHDSFEVMDDLPIRIFREGATRINPFKSSYTMDIVVTSADDFDGLLFERVPSSFEILDHNGYDIRTIDDDQFIIWADTLVADQPQSLWYTYQSPEISPQLYTIGEFELHDAAVIGDTSSTTEIFKEARKWQLASDAAGDFAVYRDATTGTTIGTAVTNMVWDSLVFEDTGFGRSNGDTRITVPAAGHYLFMYNLGVNYTGARGEVNTNVELTNGGGGDQVIGRSSCFTRSSQSNVDCYLSSAGIYDLGGAGNRFRVEAQRTDTNGGTMTVSNNSSGISVLQLDDAWEYARLSKVAATETSNSTAWDTVDLDTSDEIDTIYTNASGAVTLNDVGHYLVTANVRFQAAAGRRSGAIRLVLDDVYIPGTQTNIYLRNANGAVDQSAVYVGIIETFLPDQILKLEHSCVSEICNNVNILNNQTGMTIAKLPDNADYIRLHESGGSQAVDGAADPLTWDTQEEIDAGSFSHSTTTNSSRIEIDQTDDYLFFGSFLSDREGDVTNNVRHTPHLEWAVTGAAAVQYGSFSRYNRGGDGSIEIQTSGNSGGLILNGLTATDYVELENTDESTAADVNHVFTGGNYAIQGANISTLFASVSNTRQMHYRWRPVDLSSGLNANTGPDWAFSEDVSSTTVNTISEGQDVRLRMEVANTGISAEGAARTYKLQYGEKTGTYCQEISTWTDVDAASAAFDTTDDTNFANGDATTALLANTEGYSFVAGEGLDTSNTSGSIGALVVDEYTEIEYSITPTSDAIRNATYCFQLVDTTAGDVLDSYRMFPEITMSGYELHQVHHHHRPLNNNDAVNSATFEGAEDSNTFTYAQQSDLYRMRFAVANLGNADQSASSTYQLQTLQASGGTCSTSTGWIAVADSGGNFDMNDVTGFTDGDTTTEQLTNVEGYTFVSGAGYDVSGTSSDVTLAQNEVTELEFSVIPSVSIEYGKLHCFRLFDTSTNTELESYVTYPTIRIRGGLKVQKILGSMSGVISKVETIPESVGSTERAFIMFDFAGGSSADNEPREGMCSAQLTSASQVTVTKTQTGGTCQYSIYVIEALEEEFIVRGRGEIELDGTELSDTGDPESISSIVDSSQVFINMTGIRSDADSVAEWNESFSTVELTSTTSITAERTTNAGNDTTITTGYESIEWLASGVSVQTGEATLTNLDNNIQTATIPTPIDLDRSFMQSTYRHTDNGLNQVSIRARLTDTDEISFDRGSATNYTSSARWWVIEFPEDVMVQRGDGSAGGTNNTIPVDISNPVLTDYSFPISHTNNSGTGTAFPRGMYRNDLASSTELVIENGYSGNTIIYGWQVIDTSMWIQPKLNQDTYRWYENIDAIQPTTALAAENASTTNVDINEVIRLRIGVISRVNNTGTNSLQSKLQYQMRSGTSTCADLTDWTNVGTTTDASAEWRLYDNPTPVTGSVITASLLNGATNTFQTYEESIPTSDNPNSIAKDERGEWDFALQNNSAIGGTEYCFRLIKNNGDTFNEYDQYPLLETSPAYLRFEISTSTLDFGRVSANFNKYATQINGSTTEVVGHTISIETNAKNGYILTVQGPTLTNSAVGAINSIGATPSVSIPGQEQFGIRATSTTGTGQVQSPYNSSLYAYDGMSSPDVLATATSTDMTPGTVYSLYYLTNIGAYTPAGIYETDITYIVTGQF